MSQESTRMRLSLCPSVERDTRKSSIKNGAFFRVTHNELSEKGTARSLRKHACFTRFFLVFAIQNGGACLSGPTAGRRFNQFGESSSCRAGKGSLFANDVYRLTDSGEHQKVGQA